MNEYKNHNNILTTLNNYLSPETVINLNKNYSIDVSLLSQPIKKILSTLNVFSVLTTENNLFAFGNILLRKNKIKDIFANELFFCGLKQNNDILIWGDQFKKYVLKSVDRQNFKNCSIKTLTNGFSILSNKNLYLIKDKAEVNTIKNVAQSETVGELKIFKTADKIIYFKNDINDVKEFSLTSLNQLENNLKETELEQDLEQERLTAKKILVDKLMSNKNRLIQIIKKSLS